MTDAAARHLYGEDPEPPFDPLALLALFVERQPWRADAACRDVDPSIFFPQDQRPGATEAALAVCAHCPSVDPCLDYALRAGEEGIWGGTTDSQRSRLRGGKTISRFPRRLLTCDGTKADYQRHWRAGEPPCPESKAAQAAYDRARRTKSAA